jgi:hypothetical protein
VVVEGAFFVFGPVSAAAPAARRAFEDNPGGWLPTTGTPDELLLDADGQPVKSMCTLGPAHSGASWVLRVLEVRPVSGFQIAPVLTGRLELRGDLSQDAMLVLRGRYSYASDVTTGSEELRALAYRAATRLLARITAQLEYLVYEARRRSFAAHPSQGRLHDNGVPRDPTAVETNRVEVPQDGGPECQLWTTRPCHTPNEASTHPFDSTPSPDQ